MVFSSIPAIHPAPWLGYTTKSPSVKVMRVPLLDALPFCSATLQNLPRALHRALSFEVAPDGPRACLAHALQLPVAAWFEEEFLQRPGIIVAQDLGEFDRVGEFLVRDSVQVITDLLVVHHLGSVVPDQRIVLLRDVVEGLFELHLDEPTLLSELSDVVLDLPGYPYRVLEGRHCSHYLPQGHYPIVLVQCERASLITQTPDELFKGSQGRVRLAEHDAYILENVRPVGAPVEANDPPPLGDDHDEVARLLGGAVAGQVPQTRLLRRERRVRGELSVGVVDVGEVRRNYQSSVHLRQLVETHRSELGLYLYAARDKVEPLQLMRVGNSDEGPVVGADDVIYAIPELCPRRHQIQGARKLGRKIPPRTHRESAVLTASSSVLTSITATSPPDRPFGLPFLAPLRGPSGTPSGVIIRPKPSLSSSATRRGAPATNRTSPVNPTSPKHAAPASTGRSLKAEAMASATPRSAAGSSTLTPPVTFT